MMYLLTALWLLEKYLQRIIEFADLETIRFIANMS